MKQNIPLTKEEQEKKEQMIKEVRKIYPDSLSHVTDDDLVYKSSTTGQLIYSMVVRLATETKLMTMP